MSERGGLGLLLVHTGRVIVAELLRIAIARDRLAAGDAIEDVALDLEVALGDPGEAATPLRAIGGNGRVLDPVAAGELVEVVAGIDAAIERALVDDAGERGLLLLALRERGRPDEERREGERGQCEGQVFCAHGRAS